MDEPLEAAAQQPCCVCDAPNGKHCANCKSRHYCSKACQLFDWKEGGHNKACKQLAADFQDRLLDELMPPKKVKEEPAIVEDVAPAAGLKVAARLSAVRTTAAAKASAPNHDAPDWRGTCSICLDLLPIERDRQTFYSCCCKTLCTDCAKKCWEHDIRCPLCRTPAPESSAEDLSRLKKHVDKGKADAQYMLGEAYRQSRMGLKLSHKRAFQLYQLAAAQEHAGGQAELGGCYECGEGVKINFKTAALWYRRAAEQGYFLAQFNLGDAFYDGTGVAQSYDDAVKWFRLAAAQGHAGSLYSLGGCYERGLGVPQDDNEAMRLYKMAAKKGRTGAAAMARDALMSRGWPETL